MIILVSFLFYFFRLSPMDETLVRVGFYFHYFFPPFLLHLIKAEQHFIMFYPNPHYSFKTCFKIQSVNSYLPRFYESILRPLTTFLSSDNLSRYFLSSALEKRIYGLISKEFKGTIHLSHLQFFIHCNFPL